MIISHDNFNPFVNIYNKDCAPLHCFELVTVNIPKIYPEIKDFPYMLVSLKNITGLAPRFSLVSNNPNVSSIQFFATLTSNNNSEHFYKLSGDGMQYMVQINPIDSLMISLHKPDGTIWKSKLDTQSPQKPNPLLQISFFFTWKNVQACRSFPFGSP